MGKIESQIAVNVRRNRIRKAILSSIAVAGLLSMAMLAPNTIQSLEKVGIIDKKKNQTKRRISRSLDSLLKKGFVKFEKVGNQTHLTLTKEGDYLLEKFERTNFKLKPPKRWDEKWRIIIFDIDEKRKNTREQLRRTLLNIGFVKLQKSVWVYPYDCEDLLMLLKADYALGKSLLYIVADNIENDSKLRVHFDLS